MRKLGLLALVMASMGCIDDAPLGVAHQEVIGGDDVVSGQYPATGGLIAFGLIMPLIGGTLGLLSGWAIGLSPGGIAIMGILSASASYIAVPAAMRLALPEANPAIYLTLSLAVTFPFNLTIGIPLYLAVAQRLAGG